MNACSKTNFIKTRLIPYALVAIGLFFVSASAIWVNIENRRIHALTTTAEIGLEKDRSARNVDIDFEIPLRSDGQLNCWKQGWGKWGSQYDVYIYNNSRYTIRDWILKIKKPEYCYLDSSWNGVFSNSSDDGFIKIEPSVSAMNLIIPANGRTKIGFVMYTKELMNSMEFSLEVYYDHQLVKNPLFLGGVVILFIGILLLSVEYIVDYRLKKQAELADEKINSLVGICARFIDIRDEYTKMHSSNVAEYSRKIAREMGFDADFQKNIYCLGMLHDTGKVLIPKEIICKPGKLDDEEWDEMKKHTTYGGKLLDDFNGLKDLQNVALYHHERYDGTGYPSGLSGEEIPLEARIVCVADSYDAMHTNRSYRNRLSNEQIMNELLKNSGSQFDPKVAEAMINLLKKGEIQ